jgi:uncharacterized protein YndB with AHSA1/START domain
MIDIVREIEATGREVRQAQLAGADGWTIQLQRTLDAPIDDVWDAFTDPGRIGRWFLPISGDYRLGGHYQFEGNAGGEIVECARPNRLKVTWVYGDPAGAPPSEVVVELTPEGDDRTVLRFEHTAVVPDEFWNEYGPGAVGVGWDGGLLGLTLHLAGGSIADPMAWQVSEEGRAFYTASSEAWGEASASAGLDPDTVARQVTNTTAFYVPPSEAGAAPD